MKPKFKRNKIPEMPPAIIDAIQQNRLVLFVGAGLSALIGLPLWNKLSKDMVSFCREKSLLSRSEEELLLNSNYTSVQKLSVACYLLDENVKKTGKDGKDLIIEKLQFSPNEEQVNKAEQIGYLLSRYKSAILTTNADLSLDNTQYLKDRLINNSLEECPDGYLNPNTLTHIHGSISKKETLVFTSEDYAEKYIITSQFGELLQKALKSKTVLFIGYGVNEFELIRYFLDSAKDNHDFSLFKLDGYYEKDSYKIKLDSKYLEKLRIKLLDYSLEEKGYDALIDVLLEWDKKIEKELNPESKLLDEVSKLLSNPPTKSKEKRIEELINKHDADLRYFSAVLCRSQYFVKWLECFIDNQELFDAKKNFEYPIAVEDNRFRSGSWQGLVILSTFANLKVANKKIDTSIISIIKNSYKLIKNDHKEKEILKRRSASFGIMGSLVSIILSRSIFFNMIESVEIIKLYLMFNTFGLYSMVEQLFSDSVFIKEANKEFLFETIKLLTNTIDEDYLFSKMKCHLLEELISLDSKTYFSFGTKELFKEKDKFYTMGSFFEYESEKIANPKERFCIYLINVSAKYISLDSLQETITKNMKLNNEAKNKMALSLIGTRLMECTGLFLDFKKKIFNTQYLYSDLVSLVERNVNILLKDKTFYKELKEQCKTSSFGFDDEEKIKILRTNLLNVFSTVDSEVQYLPLKDMENAYINNVNKHVYSVPYEPKNERIKIFNSIKDLPINDAIERIQKELMSQTSFYYEGVLFDALDTYLKDKLFSEYIPHLRLIRYTYVIHYLYKLNEHFYSPSDNDISIILHLFDMLDLDHYEEILPSLLYALEKAYNSESGTNEEYERALLQIEYQRIVLEDKTISDTAISTVINTTIHSYLKLLINYSLVTKRLREVVDKVFSYYYEIYKDSVIFRAVISHFYPFLIHFNKEKYSKLFLYLFDGSHSDYCYETLAYSRNVNATLLEKLSKIAQFIDYLFGDSEDKMYVKRNYASYIIYQYITNNRFESLAPRLISDLRFISSVEDVVRWYNEELKCKKESDGDYDKLFALCCENYPSLLKPSFEVDQLIRVVSEYITLLDKSDDLVWHFLILISKHMKSYFSDEYMSLIKKYKERYEDYIVQLVDNFVDVYEKYKFSESTLLELLRTLAPIDYYHIHLIRWKRKLLKKDPLLFESFKKI